MIIETKNDVTNLLGLVTSIVKTEVEDRLSKVDGLLQKKMDLVSVKYVCELLNVARPTLRHWSSIGYLTPIRIGRKVLYSHDDVFAIMSKSSPVKFDVKLVITSN